ncbi:hypothetical protein [Gordonia soli]|nr:hypothetical protein [Gordonia soli]
MGTRTYAESITDIRKRLGVIDARGEDYILIGYSLGAAGVGDFLEYDRPRHCRGIILIADPKRHRAQCSNPGVPANRWGVAGERKITRVPWWSYSIPDDPISALPGDNGNRVTASKVTGLPQPTPARWWDAGYTLDWLWRYTVGGRHTAYGRERVAGSTITYLQAATRAAVEAAR